MQAQPEVGNKYQQEVAKSEAEDGASILSVNERVCVPYGCYSDVLKTDKYNNEIDFGWLFLLWQVL